MSLEYNKIIHDIERMGRYLAYRDRDEVLAKAIKLFKTKAGESDFVQARIRAVRESDVSGYRGAAMLSQGADAVLNERHPLPSVPSQAVIIAADGSQIYPSQDASAVYYLLNIATLTYYHGYNMTPEPFTQPEMFYTDAYLLDEHKQLISNRTVNSRRTMREIRLLSQQARHFAQQGVQHLITLHDGNLLKFFADSDVTDSNSLIQEYMALLQDLQESQATFAGYIDNPRSSYWISLLHLLDLEDHQITDMYLHNNGDLEGLTDLDLFEEILKPGQRTSLIVQNSPTNYDFKRTSPDYEIAAFYINTSNTTQAHIARVDVPMWVARHPGMIDALHALLIAQCRIQGIRPYPYVLTRADELAYVGGIDRENVEQLLWRELLKNNRIKQRGRSAKADSKDFARETTRQDHRLGGEMK